MKSSPIASPSVARPWLLITGILLVAASMRAPITGIAPLLNMVRHSYGLGTAEAGLLTTLPLLAFGIVSPLVAPLAGRYGLERCLFGALVLILAGIAVRAIGPAWALYVGTWVIGSGIAVANVLLPSLLKRDFPDRIALLTAAYVITMGVMSALASDIAVPVARASGFGWRLALDMVVVLPLLAMVLWVPQLASRTSPAAGTATSLSAGPVWRSPLAWQVTLFLGLNSFAYYVAVGWLPAILVDAGYSAKQAGSLHGLMQLATVVPGLLLVPMVNHMKDQRGVAFGFSILTMASFLGFVMLPGAAILWTVLFGIGSGATLILGLAFVSLRVTGAQQAAALSGMAQCVGYLLAATGPTLAGLAHDVGGDWTGPLLACAVLCIVMGVLGLLAGRARRIAEPTRQAWAAVGD
jgi:CP family cyanate transporter-like MFS transporter